MKNILVVAEMSIKYLKMLKQDVGEIKKYSEYRNPVFVLVAAILSVEY